MATTLRTVAQLAQVSVKTVSNVIHDHPHVSDDVRRRVEKAIQQLGYRPDLAARALRTGRSGLLALAVPRVDAPGRPALVDQIVGHAARHGFQVLIEPLRPPQRRAGRARVDAMLLSVEVVTPDLVDAHVPAGVPVIVLAEVLDGRYDCVAFDATGATRDATDHLLRTGRRRVAAIGARPGEAPGPRLRTLGYRHAIDRAGLRPPADYLPLIADVDGYRAARTLLSNRHRPDAMVCYDAQLATGVLRAAADQGVRVPDDLAVIAVGDNNECRHARPKLSAVAADPADLARNAIDLLDRRLKHPDGAISQIVVPHTVLARESTAPSE